MKYYGFSTRDYLILNSIFFNKEVSVLEIGVGTGSTAKRIIKRKVKEFYGIDISKEAIDCLKSVYFNNSSVKFYAIDVCEDLSLNKKFDIIFSADTLEHVVSPKEYFNFIAGHLDIFGTAVVTFPNESQKSHHGVSWFDNKKDFFKIINKAGLKAIQLYEVRISFWHKNIKKYLWDLPKSLILLLFGNSSASLPQAFEQTKAFQISQKKQYQN